MNTIETKHATGLLAENSSMISFVFEDFISVFLSYKDSIPSEQYTAWGARKATARHPLQRKPQFVLAQK